MFTGNTLTIVAFAITMVFFVVALVKWQISAPITVFLSAILMGLLSGMQPLKVLETVVQGFGSGMASIGLLIAFGAVFGDILTESGASRELSKGILRVFGSKHDLLAINITGFLISIPIFFGTGYIMMDPLINEIQQLTQKKKSAYVAALFTGLITTHCLVIPTPGPLAVAGALNANIAWFIIYGLVVALPASLIGGYLFSNWINRKNTDNNDVEAKKRLEELMKSDMIQPDPEKPSGKTALFLIALPILFVILGVIAPVIFSPDSVVCAILSFIGNNVIALFLAMVISFLVLKDHIFVEGAPNKTYFFDKAINSQGSLLMLIGMGGAFGGMLQASGIGEIIVEMLTNLNLPVVLLAFLLALLLHAAVGSATLSMLTSASLMLPVTQAFGYSPVIVGLAICAGSIGFMVPTDGAWWLPSKLSGINTEETFVSVTVSSGIASLIALAMIFLLQAGANILPGLA